MKFVESIHKYIEDDIEYTPVTYVLHSFQEYVDWDEECRKKAKKLGKTFEQLKQEWDDKKNKAAARGTKFHKMKEDEYLQARGIIVDSTLCPVVMIPTIEDIKEDSSMKLQDNTVYTEKMIWSKKYGVCGTADLVEVIDGRIHIKDYKTNEKLSTESYKHPLNGSKKLKYPVQGLDDCNFNIYQLQINLYMYMLLQQNRHLKMGDMTILHIHFDDMDNHIGMYPYKVQNLQGEVKAMLEVFAENHKK